MVAQMALQKAENWVMRMADCWVALMASQKVVE